MAATAERPGSAMGRPLKDYTPESYRQFWGLNFRNLRTKKFDGQDDFVDALAQHGLEVTKGTVSHWERGFRLPSIEQLPYIAMALFGSATKANMAKLLPAYEDSPATR